MTVEQAIAEIEQSGLYGNQMHQETLVLARDALRNQQQRKNPQPLTLEELKQMDGQPVWIVKNGEGGKWFIFEVGVWSKILYAGDKFNLDFYGETWLAYLYPPKEDT